MQNVSEKNLVQNQEKYYYEKLSNAEIAWHWFFLIPTSIAIGAMSSFQNFNVIMPALWKMLGLNILLSLVHGLFPIKEGASDKYCKYILENPCYVVIKGPILEELLFRDVIQNTIYFLLSFITPFNIALSGASLVSALVFGLAHFRSYENDLFSSGVKVLFSFFSGLILSQLKNNYGLPAAITLHMINNAFPTTSLKIVQFFSPEPNLEPSYQ